MKTFGLNLQGRIKNFSLPTNKPLMPLFEAVVNSIHAIKEKKITDGKIDINVIRKSSLMNDGLDPIVSFEITDNGIGFNDNNFESFMQSDSNYKADLGGKGVGRFTWLKAFDNVKITSVYQSNGRYFERAFDFNLDIKNIDETPREVDASNSFTKVRLENYSEKYSVNVYKRLDTIAKKLIFHCLVYFLSSDCPAITIHDEMDFIDVNKLCKDKIITDENMQNFTVGNREFSLLHIKVDSDMADEHALNLCGNDRFVQSKPLSRYIVNLSDKLFDNGNPFWYLGIIRSEYLDENVDMNRLAFTSIPENKPDNQLMPVISIYDIVKKASLLVEQFLKEFLTPIEQQKTKRIEEYITCTAPEYRHLKKYAKDKLASIKPNLSDDKLDEELYKIKREFDYENKHELADIKDNLSDKRIDSAQYMARIKDIVPKITDSNQSILANYVAHRKAILDLFDYALRLQEDGTYTKESFLHNLIYPMQTNSDELKQDDHNLWMIDERLAYYFYAASDTYLGSKTEDGNKMRPDILLYDQINSFYEDEDSSKPKSNIVLIEFKRPMRDDFIKDDPVSQLLNYQAEIESNKKTDAHGRLIRVNEHTKFYLYAICDISQAFRDKLKRHYNMQDDVDGSAFYRYQDNTTICVISFDKIKEDALKRNKILFDKLGI